MVINLYQKNRWGEMYSNLLKSDTKARKVIPIYIIKTIEDIWKKNNNYKNVAKEKITSTSLEMSSRSYPQSR